MTDQPRGATPQDWWTFTGELGLAGDVLPCVPYHADVIVVPGSALEGKLGKIPSAYNAHGQAHGLAGWQKRAILPAEVALWRRDRRLNLCVRTGAVRAIDVDVSAPATAFEVMDTLRTLWEAHALGEMPTRSRANSPKFLVPFLLEGAYRKRIVSAASGRIELLADGQQFVAAGTHSSGVRYEWLPQLPSALPRLTPAQFEDIWTHLVMRFEAGTPKKIAEPPVPRAFVSDAQLAPQGLLTSCDDGTWTDLRSALRFMLDKVADNDEWSEIGYALLSLKKPHTGRDVWLDISRKITSYATLRATPGAAERWWSEHKSTPPRTDYRHIFTLARAKGWGRSSDPAAFGPVAGVRERAEQGNGVPEPGAEDAERRVIQVVDAALPTNVKELSELMHAEVYTQGARLTRLGRENLDDDIRRSSDQISLVKVAHGWAKVRLSELATFTAPHRDSWRVVSAPSQLVEIWMDQTDWPLLRPLDAIARAPFVREDGSICDTAGYDSRSRTFYAPSCEYPPVPENPTRDDARSALDGLRAVFDQFPWGTPEAESAFLAHVLSEASRIAVDKCPMFWYTAPGRGIGKSLLSEMPSRIVHGNEPSMRPWVQDGDELRKTLFASLLAGDRSIAFDNVPTGHKARAPELCAFLTSAAWKDRKLGVSETHSVPNRAVVSASGNNVTPVSDLARRCLVVRLDANAESLKERRFRLTLPEYVIQNRARMLVQALTIIKAYRAAPSVDLTTLPSFERWSRMVRDPLVWLGMRDPCDTQSETDDETATIGHVFALLVSHFGERSFTAIDIAGVAGGIADSNGELSALLMQGGCSEPHNPQKVGYWLRGERDKVSGGRKLVSDSRNRIGAVRWKFDHVTRS